jgi:hypothetical protein
VVRAGERAVLTTVLRTFVLAALAGAIATLAVLANVKLVHVPLYEPRIVREQTGAALERWVVEPVDRLAVTGAGGEPRPADIVQLTEPALEGLSVATMKVRDTAGTVIGVASRVVAREAAGSMPATWWSFVMGERGTLATYVPDSTQPDTGRLLGGTRTFAGIAGSFTEHARPEGGYDLAILRETAARGP